jgi:hypothetical protein
MWAQNAVVMEYEKGSKMCNTIQLTGIRVFILIIEFRQPISGPYLSYFERKTSYKYPAEEYRFQ